MVQRAVAVSKLDSSEDGEKPMNLSYEEDNVDDEDFDDFEANDRDSDDEEVVDEADATVVAGSGEPNIE